MDLALLAPSEKEDLSGSGVLLLTGMKRGSSVLAVRQTCLRALQPGLLRSAAGWDRAEHTVKQGLICPWLIC